MSLFSVCRSLPNHLCLLTGILHRCYHQLKTVRIGSPAICNVLQRHEIRAREYRIHRVLRVAARDVDLQGINRV